MTMTLLRRALYSAAVVTLMLPAFAFAGPFDGWYDEDSAKSLQPAGQTFHQTLFTEYSKLSDNRDSALGGDGIDAELFNHKALFASKRSNINIDSVHDRNLSADEQRVFLAAAERLTTVFDRGGRELAAVETGTAQVAYDCWIEATERKSQKDAATCKARFEQAIAAAEAKANYQMGVVEVLPEPEPAPAPAPVYSKPFKDYYRVRFVFDKTMIISSDEEILQQAIHDARSHPDLKVSIRAHADRSGSDEYNMRLSRRRAEAVLARLASAGIDQSRLYIVEAVGETKPLLPTSNGVKEQENRVVEIDLRQYN